MTRTKSTYLAVLTVLLLPLTANAVPIAYNFNGTGFSEDGSSWTIAGSFIFDDSSLVAGVDIIGDLLSWTVTWSDGVISNTNGSGIGSTIYDAAFFLNVDLSVDELMTFFCSNACGSGDPLGAFAIEGGFWIATITADSCCAEGEGGWSGPTAVPEPGTLALLGIGLAGMGLARRRRKV